jgi:hypothetical protein
MKTHTLYLAVAGICTSFATHSAVVELNEQAKLDWGVDAYVRAHAIDPSNAESENGYSSRFRLTTNLILEDGQGKFMNIPVLQGLSKPYKGTPVPSHTSLFCVSNSL